MRKFFMSLLLALSLVAPSVVEAQTIGTKSVSTAGADCSVATRCAVFGVAGVPSIGVYLDVGTTGTFNFEATIDGTNWFSINDDVGAASSANADGALFFSNPGYRFVRLRASAISGTATVVAFKGFSGLKSTATLSGSSQGDGAIQDGATSSLEATVRDLPNANPLTVAITDANGDQITSFGGGTQYAAGTASATPTGTVSLAWDGANVRPVLSDASGNLQVEFASAQAVTQSGTWNIGSITTLPALPTGSNVIGGVTQSGTWNVGNTGTFAVQAAQSGTWNVTNAGTFATQAAQSGTWTVQPGNTANTTPWLTSISQGGNTAAVNASGQLSITCANCSGSGASSVDNSAWTFGSTSGAASLFVVDDTSTNSVTENSVGAARMSSSRVPYFTFANAAGTLFGTVRDTGSNDSVNVAITDASGNQITSFGGGTQYTDGLAWSAGNTGTMGLGVRKDTAAALTGVADGDLTTFTFDATNKLWANIFPASPAAATYIPVRLTDGSGFVTPGSDYADGTAYVTASSGPLGMAVRNDSAAAFTGVADGDITPLQTDSTGALRVTGGGGAVTNAGTFVVQENGAALTALQIIDNIVNTIGSTTSGQSGVLGLAAVTTSAPSYTTGQSAPLSVDTTGALRVTGASGATQYTTDSPLGTITSVSGGMMMGRGSSSTPTAMSNDNDATPLWLDLAGRINVAAINGSITPGTGATHLGKAEDDVAGSGDTGIAGLAVRRDTPATGIGANGDYVALGTDDEGFLYTRAKQYGAWNVGLAARGDQGATTHAAQSAASTNATSVATATATLYDVHVINTTGTLYFLRLYNLATAPTCSSATGFVESIPIPASTSGAGIARTHPVGRQFSTGIGYCLTGGGTNTDNTNAATGVYISLGYKQ